LAPTPIRIFFEYAFSSKRFPPDGANRGHYRNARIDALTDQIRVEMKQEKRKALGSEVQKILAEDVPYLPMCFNDVVSAHRRSLGALDLPSNRQLQLSHGVASKSQLIKQNCHLASCHPSTIR
jgi:ABC-type transport system substrate-binding protein